MCSDILNRVAKKPSKNNGTQGRDPNKKHGG